MQRNTAAWLILAGIIAFALISFVVNPDKSADTSTSAAAAAVAADPVVDADTATATAVAQSQGVLVSEYGMDARLRDRYDYASCSGLSRYGTHSLNTTQWGWVRGYAVFECAYDTSTESCYDGRFEAVAGVGSWSPQLVFAGRCYDR